jgi:DNA-binding CsgD family transcriptional regulator
MPTELALSIREREVAERISRGLRYKEIAGQLGISERTVKFHAGNVAAKLCVSGREEIARAIWDNAPIPQLPDPRRLAPAPQRKLAGFHAERDALRRRLAFIEDIIKVMENHSQQPSSHRIFKSLLPFRVATKHAAPPHRRPQA